MKISSILFMFICITPIMAQKLEVSEVADIDGNVYRTVVIGKYEWMAENLKTTTFNDGTKIPCVMNDSLWSTLTEGAYCVYTNDESNIRKYGLLYNWYAVNTDKLCPKGWHVPTDEEWEYLQNYVDSVLGDNKSSPDDFQNYGPQTGKHLKAETGWAESGNGPNAFGFSALPGGERQASKGKFFHLGKNGFWWSASEENESNAWFRCIIYSLNDLTRNTHPKKFGFSVRCIREK